MALFAGIKLEKCSLLIMDCRNIFVGRLVMELIIINYSFCLQGRKDEEQRRKKKKKMGTGW
jgi:hypothetical protein